ncbi:MAG: DUF5107 domain-containing protein [Clostridium sp.]
MKSELRFEEKVMMASDLGEMTDVPDLVGSRILQNNLEFHLDEEDEIYEAYGKKTNSYPYRQYNVYNRELKEKIFKIAILENDFIRAAFLPELGGRLWELIDKQTGKNLLYTNDVIRYSNLAVRNAWFSGGVEWNLGVIGHSPFTTEPLYTAEVADEEGNPVLRMYEYERIRGVEYQMDFWLGEMDTFLNCRMRIVNSGKKVIPMYWWSNMAVPEYENGRIVVPAKQAYTSRGSDVYKVDIPVVEQVDITRYTDIPGQVDYFFDIPEEAPKFIANLDDSGYGLLHVSTQRLRSRKLFSWGNNKGSERWQDFLTCDAGRYVEIQAGLGKTQYGCIPMAPHTTWEWMEQYGSIRIPKEKKDGDYDKLRNLVEEAVRQEVVNRAIENKLKKYKAVALTPGTLVYKGSGYGALEKKIRAFCGVRNLSGHLSYSSYIDSTDKINHTTWMDFLKTGIFMDASPENAPDDFMCDEIFFDKLKETISSVNKDNWYAHYQLGIMYVIYENFTAAESELRASLKLNESPWAYHGLASIYLILDKKEQSRKNMMAGLKMRDTDLGYVKEGFKLLLAAGGYADLLKIHELLSEELKSESRIQFDYMLSLAKTGEIAKAQEMLQPGFILDDLRECEDSVSDLWRELNTASAQKSGENRLQEVPQEWNFSSL